MAMEELTHGLKLGWNVVDEHGPSGGWPDVEFTGSREDLLKLLDRYDPDERQREYLATLIEEVKE